MNFFYAIIIGLKMKAYHFNTDILCVGHKAHLKKSRLCRHWR